MVTGAQLLSDPVDVHWAGWSSNTLTLQNHGWSVSAYQDAALDEIAIAIKHSELGIRGLSKKLVGSHFAHRTNRFSPCYFDTYNMPKMRFTVELAGEIVIQPSLSLREMGQFQPVDCEPTIVAVERRKLEDFVYFRTLSARRFLVPAEEVDDLMRRILDIQQPMREEYFREQARDARAAAQLHAQIFSKAA